MVQWFDSGRRYRQRRSPGSPRSLSAMALIKIYLPPASAAAINNNTAGKDGGGGGLRNYWCLEKKKIICIFSSTVLIVLTIRGCRVQYRQYSVKADYALMFKLWLLKSHGHFGW